MKTSRVTKESFIAKVCMEEKLSSTVSFTFIVTVVYYLVSVAYHPVSIACPISNLAHV